MPFWQSFNVQHEMVEKKKNVVVVRSHILSIWIYPNRRFEPILSRIEFCCFSFSFVHSMMRTCTSFGQWIWNRNDREKYEFNRIEFVFGNGKILMHSITYGAKQLCGRSINNNEYGVAFGVKIRMFFFHGSNETTTRTASTIGAHFLLPSIYLSHSTWITK